MAFPGGMAQLKEEGTAHNSGLCRSAVAPNLCQPFQTRVSQNSHAVGVLFPIHPLNPSRPHVLLCPPNTEQSPWAPGIPAQGLLSLLDPQHSLGPRSFGPRQMWWLLRECSQQLSHCQGHLGLEPPGS